jgi:hypothetical protein
MGRRSGGTRVTLAPKDEGLTLLRTVEARPHWQQASSCTSLRYCSEKAAFSLPIGHLRTCQLLTANC